MPCSVGGFPVYLRQASEATGGTYRDLAQIDGEIPGLAGHRSGLLRIRVQDRPDDVRDGSPWAGLSGAAVFARGCLVGVVVQDRRNGDGYLDACPIGVLPDRLDAATPRRW